IARHQGNEYWCQYREDGRFQLTLPSDLAIDDIEQFEIRFVDAPIRVTSKSPLILEPDHNAKPSPTTREQLKAKMRKMLTASPDERQELVQAFTEFLGSEEVEETDLVGVQQIVTFLESKGDLQLASQLCHFALEQFSNRPDFTSQIDWLKSTASRLSIVGKPLQIHGRIAMTSEELDWSAYENKLVLVQFWATWCGPCKGDLNLALSLHDQYSEQDFCVLGVSTDTATGQLARFLNDSDFPWTTIHSPIDADDSLSKQFGITQIPFNFLVDKNGRVLAVNLRGEELAKFVAMRLKSNTP
ncbi:MAG TPA: hypothetical protein DDW52_23410, partial [Planctomycetaceae bacterium]|nr:hypothetical protein [Planctomycetaceae bacterium]